MAGSIYSGDIIVSTTSGFLRDESGRFLSAVDEGATAAVHEIADAMAGMAILFAPKRRGVLAASIEGVQLAAHEAAAIATAPHAAPQELGAGPHIIGADGELLANKEDDFHTHGPVLHPGNPATHFLARAARAVAPRGVGIVRKHMPG